MEEGNTFDYQDPVFPQIVTGTFIYSTAQGTCPYWRQAFIRERPIFNPFCFVSIFAHI